MTTPELCRDCPLMQHVDESLRRCPDSYEHDGFHQPSGDCILQIADRLERKVKYLDAKIIALTRTEL